MISHKELSFFHYIYIYEQYAMRSCIELHDVASKHGDALVIVGPRPGENTIRTEDFLAKIREEGDSLATIMLPGINYLTGQVCQC